MYPRVPFADLLSIVQGELPTPLPSVSGEVIAQDAGPVPGGTRAAAGELGGRAAHSNQQVPDANAQPAKDAEEAGRAKA